MAKRTILLVCALLVPLAACEPWDSHPPSPPEPDSDVPACPHFGQVAVAEECNAFDDDCDGLMDEGVCDDPCDVFDAPRDPAVR